MTHSPWIDGRGSACGISSVGRPVLVDPRVADPTCPLCIERMNGSLTELEPDDFHRLVTRADMMKDRERSKP